MRTVDGTVYIETEQDLIHIFGNADRYDFYHKYESLLNALKESKPPIWRRTRIDNEPKEVTDEFI